MYGSAEFAGPPKETEVAGTVRGFAVSSRLIGSPACRETWARTPWAAGAIGATKGVANGEDMFNRCERTGIGLRRGRLAAARDARVENSPGGSAYPVDTIACHIRRTTENLATSRNTGADIGGPPFPMMIERFRDPNTSVGFPRNITIQIIATRQGGKKSAP
ncbi:MAG TPA: hypothetical protein VMB85_21700 [Bryobacteraceae bacterium]|nr:hypothetical protein [Bryobacteraceae bacterium]